MMWEGGRAVTPTGREGQGQAPRAQEQSREKGSDSTQRRSGKEAHHLTEEGKPEEASAPEAGL